MQKDSKRFNNIKEHFSSESQQFDSIITDRIPFYGIFIEALVNALPFKKGQKIKVADLGCGTGTISLQVKKRFPNAMITCVDFSPGMLTVAKKKLDAYKNISYHESDVFEFDLAGYDAILSSLCLHHIGYADEKKAFFRKAYKGLSKGGVFYIYDVILASNKALQKVYITEWKKHMAKNLSPQGIYETLRKYQREDRPCVLMDELAWLKQAGFKGIKVICKFYNGAVYGGVKP